MGKTYGHMTDEEFLRVLDNTGPYHTDDHEAAERIRALRSRLAEAEGVMADQYDALMAFRLDRPSVLAYVMPACEKYEAYKSKHALKG